MGLHAVELDCIRRTVNTRWWRISQCDLHSTTCDILPTNNCIPIDQGSHLEA